MLTLPTDLPSQIFTYFLINELISIDPGVHATATTASQNMPASQLSMRTMSSCYNCCAHSFRVHSTFRTCSHSTATLLTMLLFGCGVYVAPVISIELTDELGDDASAKSVIQSTDQSPTVIRCLVVGGFPPPTITVAFDRRDVTAHFRFRSRANVTGSRGLRLIAYRSERWTTDWRPTRADNGRRVQCLASVPGLASSSSDARLNVLCELYITTATLIQVYHSWINGRASSTYEIFESHLFAIVYMRNSSVWISLLQ